MRARIKWVENVSFLAQSESGHSVLMDGAPAAGGQNLGPRPMELLLMGTGGCTAFDVVTILKKGRADVVDCEVALDATRAETDPKVFTHIHMHFTVKGRQLKVEQVKRAIELSAEKYCSASIMLGATVKISHDFEIVEV
ncbi:OsmC family protein [Chitinimonas taiwanensis]|uniref:Putative redox protein n=1 Tax=Chitinimonas taiwanensis DSM 18899 TaxID=1121279 RepID=A0A1K2HMQ0_9NEIS|nr:OsmC family protein [Chitinimonas taiwanensis]SFZ78039.1 putative redox protein [Chitinimonas taiwanensis DSM 18899]